MTNKLGEEESFLGKRCFDAGDFASAVRFFSEAHLKNPKNPFYLSNLGSAQLEVGALDAAIVSLRAAVEIRTLFPEGHFNLGNALTKRGLYHQAIEAYDNATSQNPRFADAYVHRGIAFSALDRHLEALENFSYALNKSPSHINALINRGNTMAALSQFDEAISSYDEALMIAPLNAEAHFNKGKAIYQSGNIVASIECFDRAIAIRPNYANAYASKAIALLHLGRFEEGWNLFEWRWKATTVARRPSLATLWQGQVSLHGRSILLSSEQGLGDTLQFCRYVPMVKALGARVILRVQKPLLQLLRSLDGVDELITPESPTPTCDYECPLMSLPLAFGTSVNSIPTGIPYLSADESKILRWSQFLGSEGLKIGINWQGNIKNPLDRGRSFPLKMFSEISKIDGVRLISLQKQFGVDQLKNNYPNVKVETLPSDFDSEGFEFTDSAAVIECLDLVISSDTSIAHLAGSLGAETWVALPFLPDWRWLGTDLCTSPWYPKHKLYRQSMNREWTIPFRRMAADISKRI